MTESDDDAIPENIRVALKITDPDAADGRPIYQRYVLTEEALEQAGRSPESHMREVIHFLGSGVAQAWARERRREHEDEDEGGEE